MRVQPGLSLLLWFPLAMWACSFDTSGVGVGGDPPDAAGPGIDAGVPIDALVVVDAAVQICTPAETMCADADTLSTCNGSGGAYDDTACPLGCQDGPPAHCGDLAPSNGISMAPLDQAGRTLDVSVLGSLIFFTDTGRILTAVGGTEIRAAGTGYDAGSDIDFEVVNQAGGPSIGVFYMKQLDLAPNTELRGKGANALAIVNQDAMTVSGVIQATGGAVACEVGYPYTDADQCAGPGGQAGGDSETAAAGNGAGQAGTGGGNSVGESGGGGGAHGGNGGDGGQGDSSTLGPGGTAFAQAALIPLTGGGGGGGGGTETGTGPGNGGRGGGGGGGVQLISRTSIDITQPGIASCGVNAGGGGADGPGSGAGGGGGGAGGGILIEAPAVSLDAGCALAANGGGGSGGDMSMNAASGGLNDVKANGSFGFSSVGGDGAAGTTLDGETGQDNNAEAAGGGGGIGVIRVNTRDDANFTNNGTLSPAAGTAVSTTGTLVIQ